MILAIYTCSNDPGEFSQVSSLGRKTYLKRPKQTFKCWAIEKQRACSDDTELQGWPCAHISMLFRLPQSGQREMAAVHTSALIGWCNCSESSCVSLQSNVGLCCGYVMLPAQLEQQSPVSNMLFHGEEGARTKHPGMLENHAVDFS